MGKQAIFVCAPLRRKCITPPVHVDMNWGRGISRQRDLLNLQNRIFKRYPTLPSSETLRSFWASTANSIGSLLMTSLAYPLTMRSTAASVGMPR